MQIFLTPAMIDQAALNNGIIYLDLYEDRNGNRFFEHELPVSTELEGFWDFFKKIGKIALKILPIGVPFIPKLSPKLKEAIAQGLQIASAMLETNNGQAKELAGITAFGNQVMEAFKGLLAAVREGRISPQQAYQEADSLVAILSNPQAVYQAQRGKDAEALRNFKTQAEQFAREVKAAADNLQAQITGNVSVTNGEGTASGISSTTIIIGGGILLAIYLLK